MTDDLDLEALIEAPFKKDQRILEEDSQQISEKEPSRDSSRKRKDSSRERRKRRSRSRHRHRSRSNERKRRHRSRSKRRSRKGSQSRSRSTSRSNRRQRSSKRSRSRSSSPSLRSRRLRSKSSDKSKKRDTPREPSPEVNELDRDQRTVFVMQLSARLRTKELHDFFAGCGRVRDVRIIADRTSRRSKGVGYVEFYDQLSADKAIKKSGEKLLGIPIIVQASEAEKNRLAEQSANSNFMLWDKNTGGDIPYHRLYVGSIHFNLTEEDLRQVFEPFGPLEFVNLHKDPETGRSRGFAFIQYKNGEDAKRALEKMNGFDLAGRTIKVGLVTDKTSQGIFNLDDSDVSGLTMTSQSRAELMAKLSRSEVQVNGDKGENAAMTSPTRGILLKNMFNPIEESGEDWDKEIEDDVRMECSKHGPVLHINVDKDSEGHIYLKYDNIPSAQKAIEALNGRWFAGRQISAIFIPDITYNTKFPEAAYL